MNPQITFGYVTTPEEIEYFARWAVESFYKLDPFSSEEKLPFKEFSDNYLEYAKYEVEDAVQKGLACYLKVNGEPAIYSSGFDVNDIVIEENPIYYNAGNKFDFYEEKLYNSLLSTISNCSKRGISYFATDVLKNPNNSFRGLNLTYELISIIADIVSSKGYKEVYFLVMSTEFQKILNKLNPEVIATVNPKNFKVDGEYLFKKNRDQIREYSISRVDMKEFLNWKRNPLIKLENEKMINWPKL